MHCINSNSAGKTRDEIVVGLRKHMKSDSSVCESQGWDLESVCPPTNRLTSFTQFTLSATYGGAILQHLSYGCFEN